MQSWASKSTEWHRIHDSLRSVVKSGQNFCKVRDLGFWLARRSRVGPFSPAHSQVKTIARNSQISGIPTEILRRAPPQKIRKDCLVHALLRLTIFGFYYTKFIFPWPPKECISKMQHGMGWVADRVAGQSYRKQRSADRVSP